MKTKSKNHEKKGSAKKETDTKEEKDIPAKNLILKAVGYPFNFNLMDSNFEITNEKLFEEYAREQWLGLPVKEDSYLFDQKIIPEYGFKIVTAEPNNSIITEKTNIKVIIEEKSSKKEEFKFDNKLDDIVGQETAKNKTKILIKYFNNPEKFGKWAPRNILFYGLPGTGKTMLAKALANELEVPLYLIKATTLIGDYVGDGASKIHDLFEKAHKNGPSIIFIDEIDAIALHRSFQSLRGDVSEIVNALLTEMDGITENKNIVTIGATNNPNSIDLAVRSRFEQEIEFKLPDEKERKEIFEKYLATFPIDYDLNIEKLVKISKNMSGRDIKEKILKTSLHHAIAKDKTLVNMKDINFALKSSKIKIDQIKGMYE